MKPTMRRLLLPALTCALAAQAQSPTRIMDPQSVTGMGAGWDVDPKDGLLNMRFPLATVGGDLPIPVVLRYNATPTLQQRRISVYDPDAGRYLPQFNLVGRPAHATLHFGFITAGNNYVGGYLVPQRFVLEDGSQPYLGVQGVPGGSFTLPGQFGLGAVSASLPKVSSDGAIAVYATNSAGLGSLAATVQATANVPQGYGAVDMTTFQVLLDKNKARILVFLPALNAWVPVLWVDRFGHQVTFQWTRTVGGGGFQSVDAVQAVNGQGKGVSVRWVNAAPGDPTTATATQVLRVDFIGLQAPSLAVTGYPSVSMNAPAGMPDPSLADNYSVILDSPFLACRPTRIQVGDSGMPSAPSWAGSTPGTSEGLQTSYVEWNLNSDSADPDYCRLKSFTDPAGLTTTFSYGVTNIAGNTGTVTGVNDIFGVTDANSSAGGTSFTRSWTRTTPTYNSTSGTWSGNWTVTLAQQFSSGDNCPVPSTRFTFAGPSEAREYANGALKKVETLWGGTPWSTTTYSYGPGGEDATLSAVNSQTTSRTGEPTVTVSNSLDTKGLPSSTTLTVGGETTQTTSYTWSKYPELLAPALPYGTTTTRHLTQGGTAATSSTTKWSSTTLLPTQSWTASGGMTKGADFDYDSGGHLTSSTPTVSGFSPAPGADARQTFGYNGDGQMTRSTAVSTGTGSLGQSATYCGLGLARTVTDAANVTTTLTYDSRGRLTGQSRPGTPSLSVSYSGETSRTVSQDGISGSETFDAFGRLTRRTRGGVTETYGYDLAGRVTAVTEVASGSSRTRGASYDVLGRPVYQSSPGANNQVTLGYSASGRNTVVTATGGAGSSTVTRDPWGQVISSTDVAGVTTRTTYNGLGLATEVVQSGSGASQTRSFGYNALGFLTRRTEPETGTTSFSGFTMGGQPTSITEDGNRSRSLSYDGFGRLTSVVNGADRLDYHFSGAVMDYATSSTAGNLVRTDYTYNGPGGALSQETTKLNGTALSSIGYTIGSTGHLNSITYPSGRTVGYSWSQGRVSGVTVNGATLAGLGYDGWGNLDNVTYASEAKTEWLYNATGAALGSWKVTPVGEPVETRDYSYDANMNLNGITPDWVSLTHDAKGQLTHAQGYNLNLGFAHDVFGNNTSATVATPPGPDWLNPFTAVNPWTDNRVPSTASGKWTGWVTNGRGEALNLGSKLDSMVSIQPSWDGLGRLSGITKPGANQGYLYAPSGMRVWVTDTSDNSRSRKYGYTSGGMLLSEAAPATAGRLSAQSLRVLHATTGAGAVSRNLGGFAAGDTVTVSVWFRAAAGVSGALAIHDGKAGDPLDSKRFVALVGTGGWQQLQITLTLARADNLWVHLYGDMYTSTSSSASGSTFVDYDDLLVKKNGATLLQEGFESGLSVGTDPWSPTQWYACAAGLASLQTTSGLPDQWKRDVIYAGGRAIAEIDDKGIHELHTDHLGSPRVITAGSTGMTVALGHVEAKQAFAPYGELITDPQWTTGYAPLTGYTGHVQQDPTGLIYMRGRYYSPAWHRFLNSDQGVDPMQFNQFAYVGGSPLQYTDPSGFMKQGEGGWMCYGGKLYYKGKDTGEKCRVDSDGNIVTKNGETQTITDSSGNSQTYVYWFGSWVNVTNKILQNGQTVFAMYHQNTNGEMIFNNGFVTDFQKSLEQWIIQQPPLNFYYDASLSTWSSRVNSKYKTVYIDPGAPVTVTAIRTWPTIAKYTSVTLPIAMTMCIDAMVLGTAGIIVYDMGAATGSVLAATWESMWWYAGIKH